MSSFLLKIRGFSVAGQKLAARRSFSSAVRCLKCGQPVPETLFRCSSCSALRSGPPSMNLFKALNHSPQYDVDTSRLKATFRRLQSEYHPDKFSRASDDDRVQSEVISSFLNRAYFTVTDPYERGMYLLKLNGINPEEGDIQLAGEFLSSVMEINERLEEIQSKDALLQMENDNESKIEELSEAVSVAFKANDLNKAKISLQQMKYFISIRNRIRKLKDEP